MKGNILIIISTILVLLSSCGKDNDPADEKGKRVKVEIKTSDIIDISASKSRASLVEGTNWIGTNIGVFGLSKNTTARWDAADETCLLDNNVAIVASGNGVILDGTPYYPLMNNHAYSFFAYHPYNPSAKIEENKVEVDYTLDGSQDIIYASAIAADINDNGTPIPGYNALYIRKGGNMPTLLFSHLLTRFTFSVIDGNVHDNTKNILIKSIKIKNVKSKVTLVVADKEAPENNGKLRVNEDSGDITDFILRDIDGNPVTEAIVGKTMTTIGESIMVTPGESSYLIEVIIGQAGTEETITKEMTVSKSEGTFTAGNTHTIKMTVYSTDRVDFKAELTGWNEDEEFDFGEIKTEHP